LTSGNEKARLLAPIPLRGWTRGDAPTVFSTTMKPRDADSSRREEAAAAPVVFFVASMLSGLALLAALGGCQMVGGAGYARATPYEAVYIEDFVSREQGAAFADMVATALRARGVENVSRSPVEGSRVVRVTGAIERHEEGQAGLRLTQGKGVGAAHFEATLVFRDQVTGEILGVEDIDKQSQMTGPDQAAHASIEQLMQDAAEDVADDLQKLLRNAMFVQSRGVGF